MKISIITLFPEIFSPILNSSILKRAQSKGKVKFKLINLRDFGKGKHQVVDGRPYGGGAGMLFRADILAKAIKSVISKLPTTTHPSSGGNYQLLTILTSASGKPYKQKDAQRLSKFDHLIIICGHYEGVDQRFIDKYVDEEISIGDYVLTGGEIPTMVIADSIVRLIPRVLKKPEATENESFSQNLLEYPQYTRPEKFEAKLVPGVLLSGNHKKIAQWHHKESVRRTKKNRPDLFTQTG